MALKKVKKIEQTGVRRFVCTQKSSCIGGSTFNFYISLNMSTFLGYNFAYWLPDYRYNLVGGKFIVMATIK